MSPSPDKLLLSCWLPFQFFFSIKAHDRAGSSLLDLLEQHCHTRTIVVMPENHMRSINGVLPGLLQLISLFTRQCHLCTVIVPLLQSPSMQYSPTLEYWGISLHLFGKKTVAMKQEGKHIYYTVFQRVFLSYREANVPQFCFWWLIWLTRWLVDLRKCDCLI